MTGLQIGWLAWLACGVLAIIMRLKLGYFWPAVEPISTASNPEWPLKVLWHLIWPIVLGPIAAVGTALRWLSEQDEEDDGDWSGTVHAERQMSQEEEEEYRESVQQIVAK